MRGKALLQEVGKGGVREREQSGIYGGQWILNYK